MSEQGIEDSAVHFAHCFQGEHERSCKYGDPNCPATPPVPAGEVEELVGRLRAFPSNGERSILCAKGDALLNEAAALLERYAAALDWAETYDPQFVKQIRARVALSSPCNPR
jgi:hypothetical protein